MSAPPSVGPLAATVAGDQGDGRVGNVIDGRYRLLGRLGEGGMGTVYEAEHLKTGGHFAIKFLLPELASHASMLSRFRREARATAGLRSDHIVKVTDFGEDSSQVPYIVMEFLEGQDLRAVMNQHHQMPVPRAVSLLIQACRGLSVAHRAHIVHRDLRPENLFVCKRDDGADLLKVLDFGIAKLERGVTDSAARTQEGTLIGTLTYMPPEQVRGETDIDSRADVYALGAILYELLTGCEPHRGEAPHAIMYSVLHEAPTPLSQLRPNLPDGLQDVVHRAMAFERRDRYPDVMAFAEALAAFEGKLASAFPSVVDATPASSCTPLPATRPGTNASAPSHNSTPGGPRPRPALRWAVLALLAVAAAAGAWSTLRRAEGDRAPLAERPAPNPPPVNTAAAPMVHAPVTQPMAAPENDSAPPAAAPAPPGKTKPARRGKARPGPAPTLAGAPPRTAPPSTTSRTITRKRGSRDVEFDADNAYD